MGPTQTQSKVIIQILRSTMDRKYFTEPQTIRMHITDRGVVLPQFKHEGLLVEERRQLTRWDTEQLHELLVAS